jgi:hypothetical protein
MAAVEISRERRILELASGFAGGLALGLLVLGPIPYVASTLFQNGPGNVKTAFQMVGLFDPASPVPLVFALLVGMVGAYWRYSYATTESDPETEESASPDDDTTTPVE